MSSDESRFKEKQDTAFFRQMESSLKTLLEEKLLFQNCTVEPQRINQWSSSGSSGSTTAWFKESIEIFQNKPIMIDAGLFTTVSRGLAVQAPETICTECEFCKGERTPHNPHSAFSADGRDYIGSDQTFVLSYQCQKCKRGRLVFLVRRRGFKLQLVGRSQIPSPSLPNHFPSKYRSLFSDAEMAFVTGSHLAAICLLRIALEQYLRAETNMSGVKSGEDLWARFKERLPKDFPIGRVCGLGEVYGQLSEIMHNPSLLADDSYMGCKKQVDNFFRFLALMPLIDSNSGA